MSDTFVLTFLGSKSLAPTSKNLKSPSGSLVESYRVLQEVFVRHNGFKVIMDFHVFQVPNFDVLIGHPIEKLLRDALKSRSLSIRLGKESLSIRITRSKNSLT
jgi:hypothetical protein